MTHLPLDMSNVDVKSFKLNTQWGVPDREVRSFISAAQQKFGIVAVSMCSSVVPGSETMPSYGVLTVVVTKDE